MWRILFDWLRRAAKNPTFRRAGFFLARGGQAVKRARQAGGKVGVRMIGNSPHWVVWNEGTFLAAFPEANPKPDLDTYLKNKKEQGDGIEKWLFDPNEVENALRELKKGWRRRRGGENPDSPVD